MPARNRIKLRPWRVLRVAPLMLLAAACSGSGPQTALEPKGPIGRDIDQVWDLVLMLATFVFVFVMALLVWAIFRYRERPGDETEPKQIHGNSFIEIGGVVFSVVLLAVISVPTVRGLLDIRAVPEGDDVIQIQVTGHQWWWEFEYIDEVAPDGRTLITANELHIPAGVEVYLSMTSVDVIHSFWVPTLNGKRDVVPGRVTNLTLVADEPTPPDEPIPGQCAEFCGLAHADMRIKVHVHDAAGYAAWVEEQLAPSVQPGPDDPLAAGWATFSALCTACHQVTAEDPEGEVVTHGPDKFVTVDDREFRGSFGPNLTHLYSRDTFGSGTFTLDRDHLTQWIDEPESLKPMSPERNDLAENRVLGMPDLGLSPEEIQQVIDLLETWR